MTSYKLWQALKDPSSINPILRRSVVFTFEQPLRWPVSPNTTGDLMVAVLFGIALFRFELFLMLVAAILLLPLLIVVGIPVSFPFAATVMGAIWSSRISSVIAREHELGRYDLLSLSPGGSLGVNWAICKGCLHYGEIFSWLNWIARGVMAAGGMILTLAIVLMTLTDSTFIRETPSEQSLVGIRILIEIGVLTTIMYIYYTQTIVLSAIVGVLIPSYTRNHVESSAGAFIVNSGLQIATCTAAWFLINDVFPTLHDGLHLSGWLDYIGQPIIFLAIFYFIREGVIRLLWQTLTERLNADLTESQDPVTLAESS